MAPIKEWYGAYNVIFNWFEKNFGNEGLLKYWEYIGGSCYGEAIELFRREGLRGVKKYFEEEFLKEETAVCARLEENSLLIEIRECPAYRFMNESKNPYFVPREDYCRHDEVINGILSEKSGLKFTMLECDKRGGCRWLFETLTDRE